MITQTIADIVATGFVIGGLFFMLVGAIGIVRFPDAYHRLHASSKCSTLGLLGLLLGAVFHIGSLAVLTKAALTILFAFVATPVGSHILAKAAHLDGLTQWGKTLSDDLQKDRESGGHVTSEAGADQAVEATNETSADESGTEVAVNPDPSGADPGAFRQDDAA